MNRKKSLALADDKRRRGGETVGRIIYLAVKRMESLEQPKEAAQKPAKHCASCRECRALEACQSQTCILTDLSKSERLPTQTKDSDQGVNSFSFLVTLHYFPVSSPVVQLFFICTGRGFVIPSGNQSAAGARLTLSAAGSESDQTLTWKEAQSCVGADATAQLTNRLGGGFNSLGLSSLLVTIRQKLP